MTELRGGPFDGAEVSEVDWDSVMNIHDPSGLTFMFVSEGTLSIPRAITIETDGVAYRYELRDEEYWCQYGPNKDDGDVDVRYYYQFTNKTSKGRT